MPSSDTYFTKENAKEMQERGAKKRAENAERRRLIRDILATELAKPISKDSEITKAEYIIMRMVANLKDDVKPSDVKTLQEIMGEYVQKVETTDTTPPEDKLKKMMKDAGLC